MTQDIESFIDEYLGSSQFGFLDAEHKEQAPALLSAFFAACKAAGASLTENFTIDRLEAVLFNHMARLEAPLAMRRSVPSLLSGFFDFLAESGHFPVARPWASWVATLEGRYQALFRENGSIKGEIFKKNYTDVNRNDPCPCDSGKKFKKCCMDLIS